MKAVIQFDDGSIESLQGDVLHFSTDRFHRDIVEGNCCFLCGAQPGSRPFNDEHIIPDWVLREYGLHNARITIPNGASIPYSQYVVPCCEECNAFHGRNVEEPISKLIRGPRERLIEHITTKTPWDLFAWLNLIFLKAHLKDRLLHFSLDRRAGSDRIGDFHDWRAIHHLHCVARAWRTNAVIDHKIMGTVFIGVAKTGDRHPSFDFATLSAQQCCYIQLGNLVVFCVLNDSCGVYTLVKDHLFPMIGGALSGIQQREVLARIAHANAAIKSRPVFHTCVDNGVPTLGVDLPATLEANPGDPLELGKLMAKCCAPRLVSYGGADKAQIIEFMNSGKWTFLLTPDGKFDSRSMDTI